MLTSLEGAVEGPDRAQPRLSIAMPTRNRPELLERALRSALEATAAVAGQVEVTVSDGSDDDATDQVVRRLLADWPGGYRYVHNRPALSLPGNINRAMGLATGEWILQLHDDDYLLPDAGSVILETIRRVPPEERVLLFGVELVDMRGVVHRRQKFRHERYLEPTLALRRVLRNSSFVRQPAAVVRRRPLRTRAGTTRLAGPATPTCGCDYSPATACAACPPPAPTPPTRARPRPGCGTRARSG